MVLRAESFRLMEDGKAAEDSEEEGIEISFISPKKSPGRKFSISGSAKSIGVSISNKIQSLQRRKFSAFIEPTSQIPGSVLTLLNSTAGSGMLGLPFAFSKSGWILGCILLTTVTLLTTFGMHLLAECALQVPPPAHLYDVVQRSMPIASWLVDLAVIIMSLGSCISYLIVIGDVVPPIFTQLGVNGFWESRQVWISVAFAIVAPLSFFRSMAALEYTTTMNIVFVFVLLLIACLFALGMPTLDPCQDKASNCVGDRVWFEFSTDTFRVLPIFIFSFGSHANIFPIAAELVDPSLDRQKTIITSSMSICYVLYIIMAVAGYKTYGSNVASNLLVSYPDHSAVMVARAFVAALVICCFPLALSPARKTFMALWAHQDKEDVVVTERELIIRSVVFTGAYLTICLVVALTVGDISLILSVCGSTGSTTVAYILPGIAYYVMLYDEAPKWKRWGALALGILGLVVMPVCLAFNFL